MIKLQILWTWLFAVQMSGPQCHYTQPLLQKRSRTSATCRFKLLSCKTSTVLQYVWMDVCMDVEYIYTIHHVYTTVSITVFNPAPNKSHIQHVQYLLWYTIQYKTVNARPTTVVDNSHVEETYGWGGKGRRHFPGSFQRFFLSSAAAACELREDDESGKHFHRLSVISPLNMVTHDHEFTPSSGIHIPHTHTHTHTDTHRHTQGKREETKGTSVGVSFLTMFSISRMSLVCAWKKTWNGMQAFHHCLPIQCKPCFDAVVPLARARELVCPTCSASTSYMTSGASQDFRRFWARVDDEMLLIAGGWRWDIDQAAGC
jgi:hypothetical protein